MPLPNSSIVEGLSAAGSLPPPQAVDIVEQLTSTAAVQNMAPPVQIALFMGGLALLSTILVCTTSFTRIVIVFSFVRRLRLFLVLLSSWFVLYLVLFVLMLRCFPFVLVYVASLFVCVAVWYYAFVFVLFLIYSCLFCCCCCLLCVCVLLRFCFLFNVVVFCHSHVVVASMCMFFCCFILLYMCCV